MYCARRNIVGIKVGELLIVPLTFFILEIARLAVCWHGKVTVEFTANSAVESSLVSCNLVIINMTWACHLVKMLKRYGHCFVAMNHGTRIMRNN